MDAPESGTLRSSMSKRAKPSSLTKLFRTSVSPLRSCLAPTCCRAEFRTTSMRISASARLSTNGDPEALRQHSGRIRCSLADIQVSGKQESSAWSMDSHD